MSETTSSSEPATGPVATATPTAVDTVEPRHHTRLTAVAAWVGIVAGVVFIVAVVFFSGFFLGMRSGGGGHHHGWGHGHHHHAMMHRGGPPMWQMGPRGGGPGFGPGGPGFQGPGPQQPSTSGTPSTTTAPR